MPWYIWPLAILIFGSLHWWLARLNSDIKDVPPEAQKLLHGKKSLNEQQLHELYAKLEKRDLDFIKYLPPKQGRRYIVTGGSGLVGGWIVEHLLQRGENPQGIRIADLAAPRRELALDTVVPWFATDVSDASSVSKVFSHPWPDAVAHLPLTVFHTVAYIHAGHRHADTLPLFIKINVEGTRNVLNAARSAAGCDIFISTSSASVGVRKQRFLIPPWQKYPAHFVQHLDNADPEDPNGPLEKFSGCYAYSKAQAEKLVLGADDENRGFRTGAIRPGHAIYGHGDPQNPNSLIYDYCERGGLISWTSTYAIQYVSAQNVSLAHLLFESRMHSHSLGGRAYAITDPSPPVQVKDMHLFLSTLAHPSTPVKFAPVPFVPLLLASHLVEAYLTLRRRSRFAARLLPDVARDLQMLQPAMFNLATLHVVYDCAKARRELGYGVRGDGGADADGNGDSGWKGVIGRGQDTWEGFFLAVREWNQEVEARISEGDGVKGGKGL